MDNRVPVRLTLVSASPRRRELLKSLNIPFDVQPSDVSEKWLAADAVELAKMNARRKIERSRWFGDRSRLLIGADTLISLPGHVLGKPAGADSARRMLNLLSGRRHNVITGICLSGPSAEPEDSLIVHNDADQTQVVFKRLSSGMIADYIRGGEWKGKAGAYAIQGEGRILIERWEGNFDNVVGLPVELIHNAITRFFSHYRFL
ncbi:MAG: Maf family protein [Calditrichota bacterium]